MEKSNLPVNESLALERTKLAIERTFLAYFRTAVVFLSSGFAIFQIESLSQIKELGLVLMIIGPIVLIVGFVRFIVIRKKILKNCK
jgi:putative membrane protein